MRAQIKLVGFKELQASLRDLADGVRKRVLTKAVRAGAKPIMEEAKHLAPVLKEPDARRRAGVLRDAIRTTGLRQPGFDGAAAKVHVKRPNSKIKDNKEDAFYGRFIEYGTSKMAAKPFLRPAFASQRDKAISEMRDETKAGIEREARKKR